MKCYDLLLISVDSPVLIGIYSDKKLVKSIKKTGKFSDILPMLFDGIFKGDYLPKDVNLNGDSNVDSTRIANIFYVNGPGNFSAIKLTHIFLQSIKIAKKIPLFCTDAFAFSQNEFINAYGKIHFCKKNDEIFTTNLSQKLPNAFALPNVLDSDIFSQHCEPLYILPAV